MGKCRLEDGELGRQKEVGEIRPRSDRREKWLRAGDDGKANKVSARLIKLILQALKPNDRNEWNGPCNRLKRRNEQ